MHTLNWDDLRLFLSVARAGRLARAGRQLRIDQTTVARRLTVLEDALGLRLFNRTPRGARMTDDGRALLQHAERIEREILIMGAGRLGTDTAFRGVVRVATPETFGTHVLAPAAYRLQAMYPELRLELVPESQFVKLANRDADIAITLKLPEAGPVVARRLADYRLALYAGRAYCTDKGAPASIAELAGHPMVGYIDDLVDMPELRATKNEPNVQHYAFRSTSSTAQYAAVAGGAGIGWLHSYVADRDDRLTRVLRDVEERRSYWIAVHEDQQHAPRVRAVIDFIGALAEKC